MTKVQFALLTAALGLVTMGGAGYIAYANTSPHHTSANGASAGGPASEPVVQPSGEPSATPSLGYTAVTGGGQDCQNGQVQVTEQPGQGAAGHVSLLLVFQNTSSSACTLHGYPGASLATQNGKVLLNATRSLSGHMGGAVGLGKAPVVVLQPGGQASAVLEWSDVDTGSGCAEQNAASLLVTPPNTTLTSTQPFAAGTQVCSEFEIHPVLKGVLSEPAAQ
jgi:hypothetical protein